MTSYRLRSYDPKLLSSYLSASCLLISYLPPFLLGDNLLWYNVFLKAVAVLL